MLMSSSKLFCFSNEAHLDSDLRLLQELYCVIVIKDVCLLYYLREINNGIHIYQFTFDFYTSVSGYGCGFGLELKFLRMDGFGEKKAPIGGFAYPYSPPSFSMQMEALHPLAIKFSLMFTISTSYLAGLFHIFILLRI